MLIRTLWSGSWPVRIAVLVGLAIFASFLGSIGLDLIASVIPHLIVLGLLVVIFRLLLGGR